MTASSPMTQREVPIRDLTAFSIARVFKRSIATSAAALAIGGAAACSSEPPRSMSATLSPGTAQFTVKGQNASTTNDVRCTRIESLTMTGNSGWSATTMVSKRAEAHRRIRDAPQH
jgi:hypothetical protein